MPISDTFSDFTPGLSSPVCGGFDVTPDDSADLPNVTRALLVGGSGDVAVMLKDGDTLVLPALSAGVIYPVRVTRILASGTTATNIKGLL